MKKRTREILIEIIKSEEITISQLAENNKKRFERYQ